MTTAVSILHELGALASVYPTAKRLPKIYSNPISTEDAITQDWEKIGCDIKTAIKRFNHEQQTPL